MRVFNTIDPGIKYWMRDDDVYVFVSSVEWCRPEHVERLAFSQCAKARSWVESQVDHNVEWSFQEEPPSWIGHIDGSRRATVYKIRVEDPRSWVTRYPVLTRL